MNKPLDQEAPREIAAHELGEAFKVLLSANGSSERVADDEGPEPLRMPRRHREPDGSAPDLPNAPSSPAAASVPSPGQD